MVEDIALVAMFGLHTEGAIGMDVMLTRPRIGYMSIVHVDVPVVLAIAVALIHGILLPRQDVMVVQVRYIMNVILEVVVTVLDIGLVVEKLAVIRLVSKEVLLLVEIVHLIDLVE